VVSRDGQSNRPRHLHVEEGDEDVESIIEASVGPKVGCTSGHIGGIEHGVKGYHEGEGEEPDVVGRDVYINGSRREGKPQHHPANDDRESKGVNADTERHDCLLYLVVSRRLSLGLLLRRRLTNGSQSECLRPKVQTRQ